MCTLVARARRRVGVSSFEHNGFTAELDIDPETTLLRGKITQTGTVFHAKYVHQLESRFRQIVDQMLYEEITEIT